MSCPRLATDPVESLLVGSVGMTLIGKARKIILDDISACAEERNDVHVTRLENNNVNRYRSDTCAAMQI